MREGERLEHVDWPILLLENATHALDRGLKNSNLLLRRRSTSSPVGHQWNPAKSIQTKKNNNPEKKNKKKKKNTPQQIIQPLKVQICYSFWQKLPKNMAPKKKLKLPIKMEADGTCTKTKKLT